MAILRQLILGIAVLLVTAYVWAVYVPGGARLLDRYGLLNPFGLSATDAAQPAAGAGGMRGGGQAGQAGQAPRRAAPSAEGAGPNGPRGQRASGEATAGGGGAAAGGGRPRGGPAAGGPPGGPAAGGPPAPGGAPGGFGRGGPTQVIVAEVVPAVLNDRITAIGDGRALHSVTVRSEATGMITAISVQAGDYVLKDALVAQLDDEAERIALERAQLVLGDARYEAERLNRLRGTGSVTEVRLREADLARRTAELAVKQAEFDLSRRVIRAPISGWVGLVDVGVGDRVSSQDTLLTLTDRSELLIDFRVPERVVGQVSRGMSFEATPLAVDGLVLQGTIDALDTAVDRSSRTLRVRGRLRNDGDSLRAGMAFSVQLAFGGETYPSVDPLAVQWSSEGSFVWAVREGKAVRVPVLIRQRNSGSVLVDAPLSPGEPVVIEGVQTLRPGADVAIVAGGAARAALPDPREPKQDL